MKVSEVRIGNIVGMEASGIKYTILGLINPEDFKAGLFYPVEITEELLKRFGFKPEEVGDKGNDWYSIGDADNKYVDEELENELEICVSAKQNQYVINQYNTAQMNHLVGRIKYIHQLQNLFFALTGEELEFKVDADAKA